jgi:putative polyhydroxyalkanoate system protein
VSHISIKRPHHTTPTEARKVADKVAAKLGKEYELRSEWEGDVLSFTRSGVNGTLTVTTKELHIDIKLGLLMAAFKGPIHGAIENNLDQLIKPAAAAKKPASKSKK